jgi:hypothetical protein
MVQVGLLVPVRDDRGRINGLSGPNRRYAILVAQRDVAAVRDRLLLTYGAAAVPGFLVLRAAALYGDPNPFSSRRRTAWGLGLRTGSGQPVGVPHRQVLRAAVAVMDQARKRRATARVEGLIECVEHEVLFSEADTRHPTMRRARRQSQRRRRRSRRGLWIGKWLMSRTMPMLDLVPFAGCPRVMTHRDRERELIDQGNS